jgi:hypothetical protein
VKRGGIESVNCYARDDAERDTHIELVLDPMNGGPWSSRQGRKSGKVKVLSPSIACIQTDSISGACGGNEARSARK